MVLQYDQKLNLLNIVKKIANIFQVQKRKKSETKSIVKLNIDNKEITQHNEILVAKKQYYEKLYKKKDTSNSKYTFLIIMCHVLMKWKVVNVMVF